MRTMLRPVRPLLFFVATFPTIEFCCVAETRAAEPAPLGDAAAAAPVDAAGDPLPEGAIARFGTIRYRHPGWDKRLFVLGDRIVSIGESPKVQITNLDTGIPEQRYDLRTWGIQDACLSPDEKSLVVVGVRVEPKTLHHESYIGVVDLATGRLEQKVVRPWKVGESHNWRSIAVSPDGRTFAVGAVEKVFLLDAAKGWELLTDDFPGEEIDRVCFSPDGKSLAVCGRKRAYLWHWRQQNAPVVLQGLTEDSRKTARFSPDGLRLAVSPYEALQPPILYDGRTGELVHILRTVQKVSYRPLSLAFTPDGRSLIVPVAEPPAIELWDVETGLRSRRFEADASLRVVDVTADGRRLVGAGGGTLIQVWDLVNVGKMNEPAEGQTDSAHHFAFTADGQTLLAGSQDGHVNVWDRSTGRLQRTLVSPRLLKAIDVSPDGTRVVTSSTDDTIRLWDLATGRLLHQMKGHGDIGGRRPARFSPDGKRVATWGDDLEIAVWDVASGRNLRRNQTRFVGVDIPLLPNGKVDLETMLEENRLETGHFTPDLERFVCSLDGRLYWFEVATGQPLHTDVSAEQLGEHSISPDARRLVVISGANYAEIERPDGTVYSDRSTKFSLEVRDATRPRVLRTIPLPEGFYGTEGKFSPDGQSFAVIRSDLEPGVFVFDLDTGRETHRLENFDSRVAAIGFSPDGRHLATSHMDTTLHVWDLDRFRTGSK